MRELIVDRPPRLPLQSKYAGVIEAARSYCLLKPKAAQPSTTVTSKRVITKQDIKAERGRKLTTEELDELGKLI